MGGGGGVHLGHAHHHGHAQHEEREERQQRAVAPRHQVLERGAPLGQLQQLLEAATSGDIVKLQTSQRFVVSSNEICCSAADWPHLWVSLSWLQHAVTVLMLPSTSWQCAPAPALCSSSARVWDTCTLADDSR